jgi:copper transport protein
MKRLLVWLAACVLLAPAAAWAHATLKAESPGFEQELAAPPKAVKLHFDQYVSFPSVTIYSSGGKTYVLKSTSDGLNVVAPLGVELPRGAYTVRWHVLSADGHVVSGVWTFGVRVKAPPPTEAFGAGGPTRTEHIVRWLYFLSFAVLIGSLGFRLVLSGRPLPPRVDKRLFALSLAGVISVVEVGILAFCLRCEDVLQLPFAEYVYGDLTPIANGTRFGQAFVIMTLGFALVGALLYLAWLLERPVLYLPALVASIALLSGLSLSGHDAVDAGSSKATELADWVHISAASLWLGSLLALAVAVWPVAPELRRWAFFRFSRVAVVLVGLVLAAGTYLSLVRVPHLDDLWTQRYGVVLLVKISLVALAVGWGAVHHFVVRPRLAEAGPRTSSRIGRSLIGESMVGVAVLLVAAILVDSKPPPRPAPSPTVAQAASLHR